MQSLNKEIFIPATQEDLDLIACFKEHEISSRPGAFLNTLLDLEIGSNLSTTNYLSIYAVVSAANYQLQNKKDEENKLRSQNLMLLYNSFISRCLKAIKEQYPEKFLGRCIAAFFLTFKDEKQIKELSSEENQKLIKVLSEIVDNSRVLNEEDIQILAGKIADNKDKITAVIALITNISGCMKSVKIEAAQDTSDEQTFISYLISSKEAGKDYSQEK